jgi:hypothetical protein
MFDWLRRRRLSAAARKKLMVLHARAEEAVIETHVSNLLEMLAVLEDEIDLDRAVEVYAEMMALDDSTAVTVTNRVLARLEGPLDRAGGRFRNVFRE